MTVWIRTSEDLARLVSSLAGCRALAVDTESDSLHHHREKVCLIQLATDRGDGRLVDPLAGPDLAPLGRLLADPSVVKVFHGADYDVVTLKRDFSFRFANLFDTMIAARFLGLPEIGLQALVRAELGVALSKESQRDDWSRRPLTPAQENYALADVQHLLALHGRLAERLRALDRLAWVEEECGAVAALEPARRGRDSEAYQRIKGARRLSPRQLAVLRELHAWREARAEATDVPAFRVLGGDALLALAQRPPRSVEELRRFRAVWPRLQAEAPAILEAVRRAAGLPEDRLPRIAAARRPAVSEACRKRVEALRAWRVLEAARLRVDVSVVLPQRLLERVAEADPRSLDGLGAIDELRRWRIGAFGRGILAALSPGGGPSGPARAAPA